jgi:hypothetical protein
MRGADNHFDTPLLIPFTEDIMKVRVHQSCNQLRHNKLPKDCRL